MQTYLLKYQVETYFTLSSHYTMKKLLIIPYSAAVKHNSKNTILTLQRGEPVVLLYDNCVYCSVVPLENLTSVIFVAVTSFTKAQ